MQGGKLLIMDQKRSRKDWIFPVIMVLIAGAVMCAAYYLWAVNHNASTEGDKQEAESVADSKYAVEIEGKEPDSITYISAVNVDMASGQAEVSFLVPSDAGASIDVSLLADGAEVGRTGMIREGKQVMKMDIDTSAFDGTDGLLQEGNAHFVYYVNDIKVKEQDKPVHFVLEYPEEGQ